MTVKNWMPPFYERQLFLGVFCYLLQECPLSPALDRHEEEHLE